MNTPSTTLRAGALRHRIAIDQQINAQDATTGEIVTSWAEIAANVPAAIEPLSGREYIAAARTGSVISARITIRFRPNLNAAMRIRHGLIVYEVKAILPDPKSGKEWLTVLVESK